MSTWKRRNALANRRDSDWGFAAARQAQRPGNGWPVAVLVDAARRHADRIIARNEQAQEREQ